MEGPAQRIRRLACDLCPGKPLGEKGSFASGISAFTAAGNHSNPSKCGKSGLYLYQGSSRRNGRFKKMAPSASEEHEVDGIPSFIWSPHLFEMG